MSIGDRVKKLRIEKGMTQDELAVRLGYKSKTSVTHIENGRDIPRSIVVKLASVLDTTPSYLMGWDDEPIKKEPPSPIEITWDGAKQILDELSDTELSELRNYVRYMLYKRDHLED